MTLQWQSVEIPFGSGQDESQAQFNLPRPLFQKLQNARVLKTGSVAKRPGWISEATTTTLERVLSVDDEVFTLKHRQGGATDAPISLGSRNNAGGRIDYHAGAQGSFGLSEVEVLARENVNRDVTFDNGSSLTPSTTSNPDFAVSANTGIAVIAWEVGITATIFVAAQTVIFAKVIDVVTRQPIAAPLQISTGSADNVRPYVLLSDATNIVVVYARNASNELRARIFDCTARTWGTDTVIASDLSNAGAHYDACEFTGAASGWFVAYRNTGPLVKVLKMTGLTVSANTTLGEDSSVGSMAIYADNSLGNLWVAWYDGTNGVRVGIRSTSTLASVLANSTMEAATDTAIQMTWATTIGSPMALVWTTDGNVSDGATGYGRKLTKLRTMTTAGAKGTQIQVADVSLISKAYTATNGYTYAAVLYDGSDSALTVSGARSVANQIAFTMQLVDSFNAQTPVLDNSFRVAATWAIGEAGKKRSQSSLSSFRNVSVSGLAEQWFMLSPEFDQILVSFGLIGSFVGRPGVDLCRQNITTVPPIFAARLGRNVVFSGGVPQVWDGANLNEYGFLVPPENAKGVDGGAAGFTSLSVGLYEVALLWEYRTATGDVVQSQPSIVRSDLAVLNITIGTLNDKLTVTLPTLNLTRKWNETSAGQGVMVRAYRTEVNGTVLYREGEYVTTSGAVASVPVGAKLIMDISQPDVTAITHPKIYVTDDILPNFPPPALSYIFTHRNRFFGISAENRRRIFFTHEYEVGELPGWHPDLIIDVPDECVALGTVDEKLVILCKNGIFLVAGDGPDRKGLNSDYSQPFRLNSPHGCLMAESVVSFPNGVLFQAPTGFCLIDRQTTITRVGGPVEDTLASYPYAHAAIVQEDREWVYWSVTDTKRLSDSTGGRTICYDWRHNVWSVDLVAFPGESSPAPTFVTGFAKSGTDVFCTISAVTNVFRQGGPADPGNTWIFTYLKTAMFHLGSISHFHRARWLSVIGTKMGIHQVAFTVSTFHHATSAPLSQVFIFTDNDLGPLISYAPKMHLQNQVGAFFQVEIADGPDPSFPTLADDSAVFQGLLIDMGVKKTTQQHSQAGMH